MRLIEMKKEKILMSDLKTLKKHEELMSELNSKTINERKFLELFTKRYWLKKELLNNETYNKYLQKMRWYSHINKVRHENKLINEIKEKCGKNTILIVGDWSGKNSRVRCKSVPNVGLLRRLKKDFKVYLINEFNTSKFYYKDVNEKVNNEINDYLLFIKMLCIQSFELLRQYEKKIADKTKIDNILLAITNIIKEKLHIKNTINKLVDQIINEIKKIKKESKNKIQEIRIKI
jgi:hypothetical protein